MAKNEPKLGFMRTGKVRFSYAHVFDKYAFEDGDDPKYSVVVLIDEEDKSTLKKIDKAIEEAKQVGKSKKWGGKIPKKLELPLRVGNEEREDREEYEDKLFLNAKSKDKPQVVDSDLDPLYDKEDFKSGDYGRVTLTFYPYSAKGKNGIAVALNNIQKLEDGESLGGARTTAEDDFGDDDSGFDEDDDL